ncbi:MULTISPECIES: PQQ-dependent sugar dehydrogenase [unclassified Luteimonas]
MTMFLRLPAIALAAAILVACNAAPQPAERQYGSEPDLPQPHRGVLPNMTISTPVEWGGLQPVAPAGFTVRAIATDLGIPRQTLVLPNGDILVAEGRGGYAKPLKPKDVIAGMIKSRGNTSVPGGNRVTLLRDADGDGTYELKTVFAEGLDAPYGLALVGDDLFVANQDAVVRFDYQPGQTRASGPPETLAELPSKINHHWTKAMAASDDGRFLYVGIGSNSNITERGMNAEANRAVVWQIDVATGMHRTYATGLRNPTALAVQPGSGQLWAVVNERDEIGPDLVPDYLTSVRDGGFYGWPYSYWGSNVDDRVRPQDPEKVASAITPDYALGSHVAALGLDFSEPVMGPEFADGAFVGMHGSWNRADPVGYKVVFVPFRDGRPAGDPVDFLTGFLDQDAQQARGRPVGVTVDPRGALIVADDLSNTIWRVSRDGAVQSVPVPGAAGELTPGPGMEAQAEAETPPEE